MSRSKRAAARSVARAAARDSAAAPLVETNKAPAGTRTRPSARLVAGLAAGIVVVAVLGYRATGSPSLVRESGREATLPALSAVPAAPGAASGADARSAGLQQIAAMVDRLAERMKERPGDAEGWVMLARSYTVLGRFGESLPAYAKAADLLPKNASLLADWADAVAATKNNVGNPETVALIGRALAIEPGQPKALALAGTVAYDRGDYAGAIARWQQLAGHLPAESELRQQVEASIAEARGKAGLPPVATNPAAAAAPTAAGAAVSGTVTLAPALAARAAPTDTVFVFARPAGGGRMPLAVRRATVADLPLTFRLDDSMAMTPAMTISKAAQVVVGARISRSGNAIAQPGDLSGEAAEPVVPGASGVAIRIDRVVP